MPACIQCKSQFEITDADRTFYVKIKVPAPTFCPDCRKQRRLSWRNDMNLYSRACDLCKKPIISIYAPDKPFPVYCQKCWWSDKWDAKDYAQEYDFSKNFFVQFKELQNRVPALATVNDNGVSSVNCEYTHDFAFGKNCYMVFIAWRVEDCLYDYYLTSGKNIVDSLISLGECQYLYDTVYTEKCYQCRNIYYSASLIECTFCYDCKDCSNCFISVGLRHKQYCFKNKQYSKEEYEKIIAEYRLDTYSGVERAKKEFLPMLLKYPRKFATMRNCVDCTGDALTNGKNSTHCFYTQRPEDSKWIENSDTPRDSYDLNVGGEPQQCYEGVTPDQSYRGLFAIFSWKNTEVAYVDGCHSSKYLLGCAGLRTASYCILNKQYSEEEYKVVVKKIQDQMAALPYTDARGITYKYGEFFPAELSYFAYNESVAQEYFPLTKEKVAGNGWQWREATKAAGGANAKNPNTIPESINDVPDAILNDSFSCSQCARQYKIIQPELAFYKRFSIPIPRKCFYCRHTERFNFRNPARLWHRTCGCAGAASDNGVYKNTAPHSHGTGHCAVEFETTYSPEKKEIVYCEECYNSEIV